MVLRMYVFSPLKAETFLSHSHIVTGKVENILRHSAMFGYKTWSMCPKVSDAVVGTVLRSCHSHFLCHKVIIILHCRDFNLEIYLITLCFIHLFLPKIWPISVNCCKRVSICAWSCLDKLNNPIWEPQATPFITTASFSRWWAQNVNESNQRSYFTVGSDQWNRMSDPRDNVQSEHVVIYWSPIYWQES